MFDFFKKKKKLDEDFYKKIFENDFLSMDIDSDGNIKQINRKFATLLKSSAIAFEGRNIFFYLTNFSGSRLLKEAVKNREIYNGIVEFEVNDEKIELYVTLSKYNLQSGSGFLLTCVDFSNFAEERKEFYKQFYIDSLTKYSNRRKLLDNLSQISVVDNQALIIFDIDSFRNINNFYGYNIGDKFLIEFSHFLFKNRFDSNTLFYKLSIDTFAMFITSQITRVKLENFILSLEEKVANNRFKIENNNIDITITAGVAYGQKDFLKRANSAVSSAKEKKKQYIIFDDENNQDMIIKENRIIIETLREAINENLVTPYYQPIVDLQSSKVTKYETLMRIKTEQKILIPDEFLKISRESKLYKKLAINMMLKAFEIYKYSSKKFSLNFFPEDLLDKELMDTLTKFININGVQNKIIIEILESDNITDYDKINQSLNTLRILGCEVAIDDFGSGYANFEHILKLNLDYIKIDGSLIQNIDIYKESQLIVRTIVMFAKYAKKKTIAEYVHSNSVYNIVKRLGVDFAQGFFISTPKENL